MMRHIQPSIVALGLSLLFACGGPQDPEAEDLTSAEHDREAEREEQRAAEQMARYDPNARVRTGDEGLGPHHVYGTEVYNPTEGHLYAAAEHQEHAEAHRLRARQLRAYAEQECGYFSDEIRSTCPLLLGLTSIEDAEGGVRMVFDTEADIEPVLDHVRCHLAFAAARGVEGMSHCALYVPGASVEAEANVVSLTTTRGDQVDELRRRANLQAP